MPIISTSHCIEKADRKDNTSALNGTFSNFVKAVGQISNRIIIKFSGIPATLEIVKKNTIVNNYHDRQMQVNL